MVPASNVRQVAQPASVPTGTVTFLFTDIEGSTQRWEIHPEAMQAAVARHDEIMRAKMARHAGHVFKTVGDAFCVAFQSAQAGLAAAADAQLALAQEDFAPVDGLTVRMALHSGVAQERNADYFGPCVNRVARLVSIGHGGQVLLSDATRELGQPDLPRGASLCDLGLHHLKDLASNEHVWQLCIEGLPSEFPPLQSLGGAPNNLPAEPTSLVGREEDLANIKTLLGRHRIVSILGAGGVGKTRIAVQVGTSELESRPDGVWFADLAPITNAELVPSAVAKVFNLRQQEGTSVEDAVVRWLKRKKLLLILDNCEHVLAQAATLADAIICSCPDLQILATSRQPLRINGEAAYKLPTLATPETAQGLTADAALQYGSVKLFVERASAADTGFAFSDDAAPIVADICRRLDGIPLAIELAAARVRMLSVANIARRLNERFKILTQGSAAALPRHQTLRALFEWSYDLLSPMEQELFKRLCVFAGGFTLDGATTVCGGDGEPGADTLDLVTSLVDKSLVVSEIGCKHERYFLLESTREFAASKLGSGPERDSLLHRHAQFFCGMAQASDQASSNMSSEVLLGVMEPDLDNLRAALEWSIANGHDPVLGASIAGALEQIWYERGLSSEGRHWIEAALERVPANKYPAVVARLWLALALLFSGKRKFDCGDLARKLYESIGERHGAAHGSRALARGLIQMGQLDEAVAASNRALSVFVEYGDRQGEALCLNELADIAGERGDVDAARELYAQTLGAFERLHDQAGKAVVLIDLAELEFGVGNAQDALRNSQEAIAIESRGKNATNLATAFSNMTAYHIALADLDAAAEAARDALSSAQRVQSGSKLAWVLQHVALIAGLRGELPTAARLLGYVNSKYAELGLERESTERWGFDKLSALLLVHLSDSEVATLATEGAKWSEDQAVDVARRLCEVVEPKR